MTAADRALLRLLAADRDGRALLRHLLALAAVALATAGAVVATTTGGCT